MERTLVGNAADPKQVKRARQHDKLAQQRERDDLGTMLSLASGRRFIWKLLSDCSVFRTSFVPGDAESTAFNEGRRSIGLALMVAIQAYDPMSYHTMAKEAHDLEHAYGPQKQDHVTTDPDTKEMDDAD